MFRVDAKAEGDVVCIGGWSLLWGTTTEEAPWFSMTLTKSSTPWVFEIEPYRMIAALELLAVLVAIQVLPGMDHQGKLRKGTIGL